MVPGHEAKSDNLAIIFAFLSYRKNFVGTQNRVRISKQEIDVRAIEVRLYI